jgi:hypothetical protein
MFEKENKEKTHILEIHRNMNEIRSLSGDLLFHQQQECNKLQDI